jgi:hypothetical protein
MPVHIKVARRWLMAAMALYLLWVMTLATMAILSASRPATAGPRPAQGPRLPWATPSPSPASP